MMSIYCGKSIWTKCMPGNHFTEPTRNVANFTIFYIFFHSVSFPFYFLCSCYVCPANSGKIENENKINDSNGVMEKNGDADNGGNAAPYSSFQQLSSSQNAFTGLAGTGFSGSTFCFGSVAKEGSSLGSGSLFGLKSDQPSFSFGHSNNGSSSLFGTSDATTLETEDKIS